jgi:hypothetical protein
MCFIGIRDRRLPEPRQEAADRNPIHEREIRNRVEARLEEKPV